MGVDITAKDKAEIEALLFPELMGNLDKLSPDQKVIFKLTLPEKANLYAPLMGYPQVVRVVALSGGYDLAESNKRLAANAGMIASFSRTLREGLHVSQTDEEFTKTLGATLDAVTSLALLIVFTYLYSVCYRIVKPLLATATSVQMV